MKILNKSLLGSLVLAAGLFCSVDAYAWHGGGYYGGYSGVGWYGGRGWGYSGWGGNWGPGWGWGGPNIIIAPRVGYYGANYYRGGNCRWIRAHRNVNGRWVPAHRTCWYR